MVGAGAIITPLLGFPHWVGVVLVGSIVVFIVATAGMTSTTYVQFIKGGLLIIFATIITFYVLQNGFNLKPNENYPEFQKIEAVVEGNKVTSIINDEYRLLGQASEGIMTFVLLEKNGIQSWWSLVSDGNVFILEEALSVVTKPDGTKLYNGEPKEAGKFYQVGHLNKIIVDGKEVESTGAVGPFEFIEIFEDSEITRFGKKMFTYNDEKVTVYYQNVTAGSDILKPGLLYKLDSADSFWPKS